MADTIDELLGLVEDEETDEYAGHLIIDGNLRTIEIPNTVRNIGVASDESVLRLHFKMPRYCGEFDLSEFDIRINYINAQREGDAYLVTDAEAKDDAIIFSWLVGRHANEYQGVVTFSVCLKKTDDEDMVLQEFNTTIASLPVLEGLETSEQIIQENADILEKWRQEWEAKLFEPNYAYEAAKNAGFEGTEAEWVASLKGDRGDTGIFVGPVEPVTFPYFWFNTFGFENMDNSAYIDLAEMPYSLDDATLENVETAEVTDNDYEIT